MIDIRQAQRLRFHAQTFISMGEQLLEFVAHERLAEVRTGEAASWGDCPDSRYLVRAWQGFKGILDEFPLPEPWLDEFNSEIAFLESQIKLADQQRTEEVSRAEERASAACSARKALEKSVTAAWTGYQTSIKFMRKVYVQPESLRDGLDRLCAKMDKDLAEIVFHDTSDIQF